METFLQEYGWLIFWAVVMLVTVVLEAVTTEMISIWFTPGALTAMILSIFVKEFWIQFVVFLAISVALFFSGRRYFKKHPFIKKSSGFNADALIGQTGIVMETVDNVKETGSVKAKALVWTARSEKNDVVIPEGTVVTVVEISGVKLIVKPLEK